MIGRHSHTKFSTGAAGGAARRMEIDDWSRGGAADGLIRIAEGAGAPGIGAVGIPAIWAKVRDRLRTGMAPSAFESWIGKLELVAEVDGEVLLAAPGEFDSQRINANYLAQIQKLWNEFDAAHRHVKVEARGAIPEDVRALAEPLVDPTADAADDADDADGENGPDAGGSMVAGTDGEQTLENFVVGESNRMAYGLAHTLSLGGSVAAQVVTLYGPHGIGKTHLMRGIEHRLRRARGESHVLYLSAETFMHAFVDGVKRKDTSELRSLIRRARAVLLDDFQFIYDKPGTLGEFFQHMRAIVANGGVVVLGCDTAPAALEKLDDRMRDEIQGGVIAHMDLPERNLRREIVRSKAASIAAAEPKFALPEEFVDLLADRLPNSGRSLYGAVRNVYARTCLGGEALTRAVVEGAIQLQLGAAMTRRPKIDTIKDVTARAYGVTKADLESACRKRQFAQPRQYAMYLSRVLTECSYPQIGRHFGDRDHTTILFAYRKISRLVAEDSSLSDELRQLEQRILADPRNTRSAS